MEDSELTLLQARDKFTGLIEYVKEAATNKESIHRVEYRLLRGLLSLGWSLLVYFLKQKGQGDVGRALPLGNGQILLRSGGVHTRPYLSISCLQCGAPHRQVGQVEIARYVYGEGPNQQVPLDGALNLPEWKYSYLLQDWGLTFSSHEAFGEAGKILDKILGLNLAVRTLERVSVKVSGGVEPFRKDQVPPQGEEHELIVATSDCKGVPLTKDQSAASLKKRRGKGEKANKKKMACVGAVYAIVPFPRSVDEILNEVLRKESVSRRPRPNHKHVRADLSACNAQAGLVAEKETTFAWLAAQVDQRNPLGQQAVVCLMDGEKKLWSLKRKYLPNAIGILDLWHVMERLWKGAYVFHKEGSNQAQAWVTKRLEMLLKGKVGYVIRALRQMITKHLPARSAQAGRLRGKKKKTIEDIITYFHNNRKHMHYDLYLAAGYPIGSGVAEGACRHLVKDRLERTGMRWRPKGLPAARCAAQAGAQAILDLRATYLPVPTADRSQ